MVDFFGLASPGTGGSGLWGLGLQEDEVREFVAGIGAPVLALHGEAEEVVPVDDTRRLEEACRGHGVAFEAVYYPGAVGHSFVWPGNARFDLAAEADAWGRVHQFLSRNLGA